MSVTRASADVPQGARLVGASESQFPQIGARMAAAAMTGRWWLRVKQQLLEGQQFKVIRKIRTPMQSFFNGLPGFVRIEHVDFLRQPGSFGTKIFFINRTMVTDNKGHNAGLAI